MGFLNVGGSVKLYQSVFGENGMLLRELVGELPVSDSARARRARIHQGWWRAFVLGLEQGVNPVSKSGLIANRLPESADELANFVSPEIGQLAMEAAKDHNESSAKSGIVEIERLKSNLLSSQPLCFNFFGMLALDKALGLKVVKEFYPEVDALHGVIFEYGPSPKQDYTNDNSAFDVALEVSIGEDRGIIGIECKYTENFSQTEYDKERYREIHASSPNFIWGFDELKASKFNQLFRNQLIAEALLLAGDYKFAKTALFCAPDDDKTKQIAAEFAKGIRQEFKIIDFMEYLSAIQRQDISTTQRSTTMRLWARYMAYELSEVAASQVK